MKGDDIKKAREILGKEWGLNRTLRLSELGRALRLKGRDVGQTVARWESSNNEINGTVSVCIEMMLNGAMPPDDLVKIIKYK